MLKHELRILLLQLSAIDNRMAQKKTPITRKVDIDNLDVRIDKADIILP